MAKSFKSPKSSPETCRTEGGAIICPKCGNKMVPMSKGNGFRCGAPGNRFMNGRWTVCNEVVWNKTKFMPEKKEVIRAEKFPTIKNPTTEQLNERKLMGQSPAERGGRCVITDAGPGTGKTTTKAWGAEALYNRRKNLVGFPFLAFNTNARDVLNAKLPAEVPDVATLNSWHARAQGFKFNQYQANKLATIWKDLVSHLPHDERPRMGVVGKVIERMRDCCLFNTDESNSDFWGQAVAAIIERFPSLGKKIEQTPGASALVREYLPALATRAHAIKTKIDIQEQVTRPVWEAIRLTGWQMRFDCVSKPATEWSDDDVRHFAKLIKSITLPRCPGMIVDEAQDLSLCQIAVVLAQVWEKGELFLIGDDAAGEYGEPDFKAGQAIYGWRGAFGGSLTLIARLWEELTGEQAIRSNLTVTFRHGPEICDAYRPLNNVIKSGLKAGTGEAWEVHPGQAFTAWINIPEGQNALWITRTNAPLSRILIDTLKEHEECCIRGGGDFLGTVDNALYGAAGFYDANGEYAVSLSATLSKLEEIAAEAEAQADGKPDPNSVERFLIEIGKAITQQPELLRKADLQPTPTVGNLRRFIAYFCNKEARRVLTTVYRCKGDEADLAIVSDIAKFNESWGDVGEDRACRHVAASRAKRTLLTVGHLTGTNVPVASGELYSEE